MKRCSWLYEDVFPDPRFGTLGTPSLRRCRRRRESTQIVFKDRKDLNQCLFEFPILHSAAPDGRKYHYSCSNQAWCLALILA